MDNKSLHTAAYEAAQAAQVEALINRGNCYYPDKFNEGFVQLKDVDARHRVLTGAPCEWSEKQGATHTLWLGVGPGKGSRPAKLKVSVIYVGIDEDENGNIVWEKWQLQVSRCDHRHILPA